MAKSKPKGGDLIPAKGHARPLAIGKGRAVEATSISASRSRAEAERLVRRL
jgi:hypothetical protein